ncbi:MAG: nicotinate-nucleotide adenylyltransferase [Cyanobacteria bacterium P01_A01_bin.45]
MKIALFGTSADPPTAGHQKILTWLSERYDQVAVWAAENPFKDHQASIKHRVAMLQLLITDASVSKKNIILAQDLSYLRTIKTLQQASERWGEETEFTLVVGSDLLKQLKQWYRIADLLKQVKLLVVPRPGYVIDHDGIQSVKELGGKIAIASLTGLETSSTAYRQNRDEELLVRPVAAYIQQEHLYECRDKKTTNLQPQ